MKNFFTYLENNSFLNLKKDEVKAIAIGRFDGIHQGHMQLINELKDTGALLIINKNKPNLSPDIQRYANKTCFFYEFEEIRNLSGAQFIEKISKEFNNLSKIVVGYDFRFGKNRLNSATDIFNFFSKEVKIIQEFCIDGFSVHSGLIRKLLLSGEIKQANKFLGREYCVGGEIIKGQGLGSKKLVPTLNLNIKDYLLPLDGVYATRTKIKDKIYKSVSFLGKRNTDNNFSVETHIIDEKINDLDYAEIYFKDRIRDNFKFRNLDELLIQIKQDIKKASL